MQFVILVNAAPFSEQSGHTAYAYCNALLDKGHQLIQLFFFQNGCYHALMTHQTKQSVNEQPIAWQRLSRNQTVPLKFCTTAAARRGIENSHIIEASSLSQFIAACDQADRIVTFGA